MPRLFLAAYPPLEIARDLLEQLATLGLPDHRATPPEQVHVTVLFLGDVAERELSATIESAERAAASVAPFELRVERLETLPERSPARLVAAVTDAPRPLLELRARLVARLATRKQRSEALKPHLTLARFRAPVSFRLPQHSLDVPPFRIDALSLQQSILRPAGAEHRQVARIELAGR